MVGKLPEKDLCPSRDGHGAPSNAMIETEGLRATTVTYLDNFVNLQWSSSRGSPSHDDRMVID